MEEKKYELTDETIDVDGHILHRIKAIRDFGDVNVGELGGFIEKEENLSHNGKCWVCDDARVCGYVFNFLALIAERLYELLGSACAQQLDAFFVQALKDVLKSVLVID